MSFAIHTTLLTALIAFAGIAQAGSGYTPKPVPTAEDMRAPALSRTQVKADLVMAIKDGSLARMNRNSGYPPDPVPVAGKPRTRAEVMEELRQAQADGSMRRIRTNRGF